MRKNLTLIFRIQSNDCSPQVTFAKFFFYLAFWSASTPKSGRFGETAAIRPLLYYSWNLWFQLLMRAFILIFNKLSTFWRISFCLVLFLAAMVRNCFRFKKKKLSQTSILFKKRLHVFWNLLHLNLSCINILFRVSHELVSITMNNTLETWYLFSFLKSPSAFCNSNKIMDV